MTPPIHQIAGGVPSASAQSPGVVPILALAPMQDVTDLGFLRLMARYGGADLYVTEYFRVYPGCCLNRRILQSITENPTGRPILAQMIGNDVPSLMRTAKELQRFPIVGVDLNLGCPAPVVYRKCAGGGLLRDLDRVDAILGALREVIAIPFTVKTRLGFDSPDRFEDLLQIFSKHAIDLLTIHARTVSELYRTEPHYEFVAQAVAALSCPVLANGNIVSAHKADQVLKRTGAHGLMVGRAAIRNPWLFAQIRSHLRGGRVVEPTGRKVLDYIRALHEAACSPRQAERSQVQRMKKFMNFVALGVDAKGEFLHLIRRAATLAEFFRVCEDFLDHNGSMPLEPFPLELKPADVLAGEHG